MKKFAFYFSLLLFLLNSCKKENGNCFNSTGSIVTEIREISDFNSLKMLDNVDVELFSGDENKIEVTAGENIIHNITAEVIEAEVLQDSVPIITRQLVIKNLNACNWLRSYDNPIKVKITYKFSLDIIEYRSIGDLTCLNTIDSDTFSINIFEGAGIVSLDLNCRLSFLNFHYGTADLNVKGTSMVNYIYQASYGPVNATEFKTDFNYLENRGSNNCFVFARLFLGATISSIGNVYYTGNPEEVSLAKNGSGSFYEIE
jgi:hypothetical protein